MTVSKHLMLDLETFALSPDAFVWEVGLMPFKLDMRDGNMLATLGPADRFILNPFRHHAERIDEKTVQWTRENRKDFIAGVICDAVSGHYADGRAATVSTIVKHHGGNWLDNVPLLHAAIEACFAAEVPQHDSPRNFYIWARNAAFDFPILENLFKGAGLKLPWHRRQQCCVYTAQNMALMQGFVPAVTEATHQAADDCEKQVQEVIAALSYLHKSGVAYV